MAQPATQKRTPLGIEINTLLEPKPEIVQLPLEPIYENTLPVLQPI